MKLLEKIIELVYFKPEEKELKDKCEIFLYPETAEKLKEIKRILETFERKKENPYKNDYETRKAELFRKVIGIAFLILNQFVQNNNIIILEKKKKKITKIYLSSCLKRAN